VKFHLPSFLMGIAVGAAGAALAPRLKPVLLELATAGYKVIDAVAAKLAMKREDLEDLLAEAKARARGFATAPSSANGHAAPTPTASA
jgi:hypothetical protein